MINIKISKFPIGKKKYSGIIKIFIKIVLIEQNMEYLKDKYKELDFLLNLYFLFLFLFKISKILSAKIPVIIVPIGIIIKPRIVKPRRTLKVKVSK